MATRLPLTVIIPTIEPWPDLDAVIEVLQPQVESFGGEIIIASSDVEAPAEGVVEESGGVRWLRRRDATIPRLRAMAAEIARGEIVATTEDDCKMAPDWCAEIVRGFALHPLAHAIMGVTSAAGWWAGSSSGADRWSSRPARERPVDANLLNANVAYQRSVFPSPIVPIGFIERDLNPRLLRDGGVILHEAMRVERVRQRGLPGRAWRLPTGLPGSWGVG